MLGFYHSADFDGICSAAILKKKFPHIELYGIDYNDSIPWEIIKKHDDIIMCDFSFNPFEKMKKIYDKVKGHFVWIDHHKSAISEYEQANISISGLLDSNYAACELVWKYFYPDYNIPYAIKLLGRYDVWDFNDENTFPFQYGMRMESSSPDDYIWKILLSTKNAKEIDNKINEIIKNGNLVIQYQEMNDYKFLKSHSFVFKFKGYNCLACNTTYSNSQFFKHYKDVYSNEDIDIFMPFSIKDDLKWKISMFSNKDDIDVSLIAKEMGGGGHKNAAGFIYTDDIVELIDS